MWASWGVFLSVNTWRHSRRQESFKLYNLLQRQDEFPLCGSMHTTFFDKTDVTVLCSVALIFDRDDLNCVFGHVDFLTPYERAQYNRRLQHFLKKILNAMCWFFFKMRKLICLLDIIIALQRWARGKRKLCTELERGDTENKMFWQRILYHYLL